MNILKWIIKQLTKIVERAEDKKQKQIIKKLTDVYVDKLRKCDDAEIADEVYKCMRPIPNENKSIEITDLSPFGCNLTTESQTLPLSETKLINTLSGDAEDHNSDHVKMLIAKWKPILEYESLSIEKTD